MKKKFVLIPVVMSTILSFIVVIKSFDKGMLATTFALLGFVGFMSMSVFFAYAIKQQDNKNSSN